jgi:hypothetical protein
MIHNFLTRLNVERHANHYIVCIDYVMCDVVHKLITDSTQLNITPVLYGDAIMAKCLPRELALRVTTWENESGKKVDNSYCMCSPEDAKALQELGLDESSLCDVAAITRAYREKSIINHPDKPSGNKDRFIQIHNAYKQLVNDAF